MQKGPFRRRLVTIAAILGTLALPGAGVRSSRASLLLARPRPRHVGEPAGRRQGARRCARSSRPSRGKGAGKVRVVCQGRGGRQSLAGCFASRSTRPRSTATALRPSQPKLQLSKPAGPQAAPAEPRARAEVQATTRSSPRSTPRPTTTASWSCRAATPSRPRASSRSTIRAARTSPRPTPAARRLRATATRPRAPTTRT